MEELEFITCNLSSNIRYETLEGKKNMVVPCVMLVEGVLEGNNGPGFYPKDENAKAVPAWNHKPIVVYHPEKNGKAISAATPEVLNTRKIGVVLNTLQDDSKTRTECWIDIEQANKVDKRIVNNIKSGKITEVSTGLFLNREEKEGTFNGKSYTWVARQQQPDHLAILPDKKGACSIKDGAGLLQVNEGNVTEEGSLVLRNSLNAAISSLSVEGAFTLETNELSFSGVARAVAEQLASNYGEKGKYWNGYILDIYPKKVIFNNNNKTWMVDYVVKDEEVKLSGKPVEVVRVTEYKTLNGSYVRNQENDLTFNEKETEVFVKKTHIDTLIANGQFDETNRTWLESLDDKTLEGIKVKQPTTNATVPPPAPAPAPSAATLESWMKNAPPEVQVIVNRAIQTEKNEKDRMITNILKSPSNIYKKEYLETQDVEMLRGIEALAMATVQTNNNVDPYLPGRSPNYIGAMGYPPNGLVGNAGEKDDEEPLTTPTINRLFAKSKN